MFGALKRWLSGSLSTPPEIPEFVPSVPSDDAEPSISPPDATRGGADGLLFAIEYMDAKGNLSRRRITVKSYDGRYLRAWCHERQAWRTFRVDRIRCIIDENGEIHDPGTFFRVTPGFELERPGAGEDDRRHALREPIRPHLRVLAAIARADGRFTADEIPPILAFTSAAHEVTGLAPLSDDDLEYIASYVRRLRPLPNSLAADLDAAAGGNADIFRLMIETCVPLVRADGRVTPEERAVIDEIRDYVAATFPHS